MLTLRPYQQAAVSASLEHFKNSKSPAVLALPTGAGKSIIIAKLTELAKGRVLILAHVKELVEQNFEKYKMLQDDAGIFSAGLNKKETENKVLFASIQSVFNAKDRFFENFNLLIIDECHRVGQDPASQYHQVIQKLKDNNKSLCILGLTATPYRLDLGWIYEYHYHGEIRSRESKFFKKCIYEIPIEFLIKEKYLTQPIKINSPVSGYDFSKLQKVIGRMYSPQEIENVLIEQHGLTPILIDNLKNITTQYKRQGVMIFTASIRHAREILRLFERNEVRLITGDTPHSERDMIITDFKEKRFTYLINVSVLTTGFDAPHVDLIAILRPTESLSLYQQIIGRGLRLAQNKEECLILDYTGQDYDIFSPEIGKDKPISQAEIVEVKCPLCLHPNKFWGIKNKEGEIEEHFGRRCKGAKEEIEGTITPCPYLFRYKVCPNCGTENDIAARECSHCNQYLLDMEKQLKEARSTKDAHVMRVDSMSFKETFDKKQGLRLSIFYYDIEGNSLQESYSFKDEIEQKVFYFNFVRLHHTMPGHTKLIRSIKEFEAQCDFFKIPKYIIAKKLKNDWKITEKFFDYNERN